MEFQSSLVHHLLFSITIDRKIMFICTQENKDNSGSKAKFLSPDGGKNMFWCVKICFPSRDSRAYGRKLPQARATICRTHVALPPTYYRYASSVAGFLNGLFSFDPTTMVWRLLSAAANSTHPSSRSSHGFMSASGKLYVHGGYSSISAGRYMKASPSVWVSSKLKLPRFIQFQRF